MNMMRGLSVLRGMSGRGKLYRPMCLRLLGTHVQQETRRSWILPLIHNPHEVVATALSALPFVTHLRVHQEEAFGLPTYHRAY
jgi:hypothetical protein